MKNMTPKRWLTIAGVCAVLWFLSGWPEITESESALAVIVIWTGFIVGLFGLVALALAAWGLFAQRARTH